MPIPSSEELCFILKQRHVHREHKLLPALRRRWYRGEPTTTGEAFNVPEELRALANLERAWWGEYRALVARLWHGWRDVVSSQHLHCWARMASPSHCTKLEATPKTPRRCALQRTPGTHVRGWFYVFGQGKETWCVSTAGWTVLKALWALYGALHHADEDPQHYASDLRTRWKQATAVVDWGAAFRHYALTWKE